MLCLIAIKQLHSLWFSKCLSWQPAFWKKSDELLTLRRTLCQCAWQADLVRPKPCMKITLMRALNSPHLNLIVMLKEGLILIWKISSVCNLEWTVGLLISRWLDFSRFFFSAFFMDLSSVCFSIKPVKQFSWWLLVLPVLKWWHLSWRNRWEYLSNRVEPIWPPHTNISHPN